MRAQKGNLKIGGIIIVTDNPEVSKPLLFEGYRV